MPTVVEPPSPANEGDIEPSGGVAPTAPGSGLNTTNNGDVGISAVPVPTSALLFAFGTLGLGTLKWRRARALLLATGN
jgi:hypothetical protein